jgi:hypothetical protein
MPGITSVIEALITSTFVNKQIFMLRANKTEWVLLAFCTLCAGAGIFFLVLALYQYLGGLYAPYLAALISSALVFATALVTVMLKTALHYKKPPNPQSAQDEFSENIHALIKDICRELEDPVRENPKTSVAIAAIAGLLAARRI